MFYMISRASRSTCAVLAFLAAVVGAAGEARTGELRRGGNILFERPAGWEVVEREVGNPATPMTVLRPQDWLDRDDPVIVHLPRGIAFSGPVETLGAWGADHLLHHLDLDDDEFAEFTPWNDFSRFTDIPSRVGGASVFAKGSGRFDRAVIAFLLQPGDRAELVFSEVDGTEDARARIRARTSELLHTVRAFQYISTGAPSLTEPPLPGPLDGLWWGTRLRFGIGLDGMMTTDLAHEIFAFSASGTFYEGVPPGGVDQLNDADLAMIHTAKTGVYRVKGNVVTLHYADGNRDELVRAGHRLAMGEAQLVEVRLPPDGFTFDGARESASFVGLPASGLGNASGLARSSRLTFSADGRFVRESHMGAFGSYDTGNVTLSSDGSQSGTYRVAGGEMILTFGDGTTLRWPAFIAPEGEDRLTLWLGEEPVELDDAVLLANLGGGR